MSDYHDFIAQKVRRVPDAGFDVRADDIHPALFDFQRVVTQWAIRKGRAAIFLDTGLGKTVVQAEVMRLTMQESGAAKGLIIAPLSVARQTIREVKRLLGYDIHMARSDLDIIDGINITNYEMIDRFEYEVFGAVALDESSILKSVDGKTRERLIEHCADIPYRHCYTATPAPNDISEIANHAEFLGVMTRTEMLSQFFVHDDEGWRLKRPAIEAFYKWLSSWGMSIRKPSDIGFDDNGYVLPPLSITPLFVDTDYKPADQLFFTSLKGITERVQVRKHTLDERVEALAALVNADAEQWIVWCGLNDEADAIASVILDSVNVQGSDSAEKKNSALEAFQDGKYRVLITKAKIAGHGMNFQSAHKMAFLGLSDSWESYYQCIRRCYRFGQTQPVSAYIVLSTAEAGIHENIMQKEAHAKEMSDNLIKHVREYEQAELGLTTNAHDDYKTDITIEPDYTLMLGDSVERIREIPDNSIDMMVYSPPFASLYTYSPSERDMGNSASPDEFLSHFGFLIREQLRVLKPGRVCCVHVFDIPAMLVRDGYIGLKDFSGDVARAFIANGFVYDARIPIDKNPQAQSIRTRAKGLTFTQMEKDRTWSRPGLPDYILKFRKPGDNVIPVSGGIERDTWIDWASPTWGKEDDRTTSAGAHSTWYGIHESDTLNAAAGRDTNDERHIAPLQLETIRRCVLLWSNAGETVFTPFAGIGSELYVALENHRKAIGIELKPSYYRAAQKNLRHIMQTRSSEQNDLFAAAGVSV